MDAMIAETDDEERPVAYNRVAGVVVTGNEDGAHHVIAEVCRRPRRHRLHGPWPGLDLLEQGPGPGEDYSETEEGHEWSHSTGRAAAANLLAVARALEAKPIPAPPSE